MQNHINSLITMTETTLNKTKSSEKEILEQILRCEYLLSYIAKAEKINHISKAQKLHCEIQVLSLIASLEKLLKKSFNPKMENPNPPQNITISAHRAK